MLDSARLILNAEGVNEHDLDMISDKACIEPLFLKIGCIKISLLVDWMKAIIKYFPNAIVMVFLMHWLWC